MFKVIQIPELILTSNKGDRLFTFPEKTTEYIAFSEDFHYYDTPKENEPQKCTKPPVIICKHMPIVFPVSKMD